MLAELCVGQRRARMRTAGETDSKSNLSHSAKVAHLVRSIELAHTVHRIYEGELFLIMMVATLLGLA